MPDTIDALVRHHSAQAATKPMVIDSDSQLSYRELDCTTANLAAGFIEAGVGKGTRVGLIMPNGVRWVQIAIALTRIGAVLVPLSTLLPARELIAQLRTSSTQLVISVEEFRGHRYLDDLAAAFGLGNLGLGDLSGTLRCTELPALRQVWLAEKVPAVAGGPFVDAVTATVTPSDTMVIMFTSGSSGPPKGVMHSHGGALGAVRAGLASRCIEADTRLYLPMPFFWVGGFASGVLSALVAGATLITEEIPHPETTLRLLERERVTLFRGWPDQAKALARHPHRARAAFRTGIPGNAVRHDRSVRAVLRLPRRHRYAVLGVGQLRQTLPRHGGADHRPGQWTGAHRGKHWDDRDSRPACAARDMPAQPRGSVHP